MAVDLLEWCGRHADGLFIAFSVSAAVYLVAGVIVAIDQGVAKYRARDTK